MIFKHLISSFDTIECAYYLIATDDYKLDFIELAAQKEAMVRAKVIKPKPIQIGSSSHHMARAVVIRSSLKTMRS